MPRTGATARDRRQQELEEGIVDRPARPEEPAEGAIRKSSPSGKRAGQPSADRTNTALPPATSRYPIQLVSPVIRPLVAMICRAHHSWAKAELVEPVVHVIGCHAHQAGNDVEVLGTNGDCWPLKVLPLRLNRCKVPVKYDPFWAVDPL